MVREPATHVISMYFHCTESSDHKDRWKFMPSSMEEWLGAWHGAAMKNGSLSMEGDGMNEQFQCYNPINMQTARLKSTGGLDERFAVVGLLEEFDVSTCLMSIRLHAMVPPRCNCSTSADEMSVVSNTDSNENISNTTANNDVDHGVSHHGGSFQPSAQAVDLIKDLTREDTRLYANAVAKLQRDIEAVEAEYSFCLCRNIAG
jgi:hypothetical protein